MADVTDILHTPTGQTPAGHTPVGQTPTGQPPTTQPSTPQSPIQEPSQPEPAQTRLHPPAELILPGIGSLTSASEDSIVDPSELVLEHIDIASWKWPEYFAFSLTRMEELFPFGGIPRGIGSVRQFDTVDDVLRNTHTDAWLVSWRGWSAAMGWPWPRNTHGR